MTHSWDDFPVVDGRPPKDSFWRFPDATWWVVFMAVAGPEWVVSTTDRKARKPVVMVRELTDGSLEHVERPFTAEDQAEADDGFDRDLAEIGLPPRPRGRDWYLRIDRNLRKPTLKRIGRRVEGSIPGGLDGFDYLPTVLRLMETIVPEELANPSED